MRVSCARYSRVYARAKYRYPVISHADISASYGEEKRKTNLSIVVIFPYQARSRYCRRRIIRITEIPDDVECSLLNLFK